ncbi:hypothetical protein [Mycobacteroides abscessus]|uniref:hypothetical protein n=1 Tax=Mycobacteroides abscessus TaxID=36809 RepID=UPI0018786D1C|nr:hypothetical protein [Mycobacteroides abscessus]
MITIQFVKNVGDFTKGQVASVDENSAEALIRRKDAVRYPAKRAGQTQGQADADQTEQNTETEGQENG